jgi:hypothetical protein
MDGAVPMKSAKTSRPFPSTAPKNRGNILAARNPRANEITMPNVLTRSALLPWRKMLAKSIAIPAVRRNKTTLIATIPSSTRATVRELQRVGGGVVVAENRQSQQNARDDFPEH